jgi:hypothetical protein
MAAPVDDREGSLRVRVEDTSDVFERVLLRRRLLNGCTSQSDVAAVMGLHLCYQSTSFLAKHFLASLVQFSISLGWIRGRVSVLKSVSS